MRSDKEIMGLILDVAREDARIRAALLVGSRANPSAPADSYQDFDITYIVEDIRPYSNNTRWIEERFGKPGIMQMPDLMAPPAQDTYAHFAYLMIFDDGVRIDLTISEKPGIDEGEPAIALIDKDGRLAGLPHPDDSIWHVRPPSEKQYSDCCNEFWWCLNNVGKGIARDELPYAMRMLNVFARDMLDEMLGWHVGVDAGFTVSVGKFGKYFRKHLPESMYSAYLMTYSSAKHEQIWVSVLAACNLFHEAALHVAEHCGFIYNQGEEDAMRTYLNSVRHPYYSGRI